MDSTFWEQLQGVSVRLSFTCMYLHVCTSQMLMYLLFSGYKIHTIYFILNFLSFFKLCDCIPHWFELHMADWIQRQAHMYWNMEYFKWSFKFLLLSCSFIHNLNYSNKNESIKVHNLVTMYPKHFHKVRSRPFPKLYQINVKAIHVWFVHRLMIIKSKRQ